MKRIILTTLIVIAFISLNVKWSSGHEQSLLTLKNIEALAQAELPEPGCRTLSVSSEEHEVISFIPYRERLIRKYTTNECMSGPYNWCLTGKSFVHITDPTKNYDHTEMKLCWWPVYV